MYQFYQNTLTVPAKPLYEDLDVMSESNYKKLCRTGKINRVRTARGLDNTALVDFESLPERFRVDIVRKIGYPPKKNTQNLILNHYHDDFQAIDFFASYMIDEYRTLSPEHQEEYLKNAQMLDALDTYIKEMVTFRCSRGGKAALTQIWQDATQSVADVQEQIGHTLPKSVRRLKEKLEDYKRDGYAVLISDNFGNNKAAKVKDTQQEAVLRELLRKHQGFDNEKIAKDYNLFATAMQWELITAGTVANYRKKWKFSTFSFQEGSKAFDNTLKMQVKRRAPEYPNAMWVLDGWKVELLYQKFTDGKTTYHNRLTMVVVLDPCTKYPVGYAIGEQENTGLIKAALRNAVNHTEELFGYKHKVYQIQADNYSTKTMTPIYRGVAKKYIPTKVGNAKAKVIEPWFRHFNKTYCQSEANWSGQGVKSKQQPNPDFLQANRKNFPTEEQCFEQIERLINKARQDKLEAYLEAYAKAPEDLKEELNLTDYLKHLGVRKPDTTKYRGTGIEFRVNHIMYSYESFNADFRQYTHLDWDIFFDPQNMEKVLAFNADQQIQFELEEKYIQPMDLYTQEREDRAELGRIRKFNNYLEMKVLSDFAEDVEIIDEMVFENKKVIDETLEKLVITDSVGQHKDQRNGLIAAKARQKVEKQQAKIDRQEERERQEQEMEYLSQKRDYNKYMND